MEKVRINSFQLSCLIIGLILSTGYFTIPTTVAGSASQDGWLAVLLATLAGLVMLFFFVLLSSKFIQEKENIISYTERTLGKFLGKLIGFLFALYFLISNTTAIRLGGELIVTNNLMETPIEVIHLALIILGGYAAWHGIEVISRMVIWVLVMLLFSIFTAIFLTTPEWNVANITPVFEQGFAPILLASITPFGWIGQSVILLIFYPNLSRDKNLLIQSAVAVFVAGFTLAAITFSTLIVFGPSLVSRLIFSFFELNAYSDLVGFLERLEIITTAFWLPGVLIKVAIWYYAFMVVTAQILNLKDYRVLTLATGVLLFPLANYSAENILELGSYLRLVWPLYAISTVQVVIPLLLLAVSFIIPKNKKKMS